MLSKSTSPMRQQRGRFDDEEWIQRCWGWEVTTLGIANASAKCQHTCRPRRHVAVGRAKQATPGLNVQLFHVLGGGSHSHPQLGNPAVGKGAPRILHRLIAWNVNHADLPR